MDWQQKAAAFDALADLSIKCRGPSDWYVSQEVAIRDEHCTVGSYGNGKTPVDAIEDHWRQLVDEIGSRYLVANSGGPKRRAVRWNGIMWADVAERKSAQVA